MRSFLTLLGISVGIAAIVALGAIADGLQQGFGSLVGGGKADLVVSQAEAIDVAIAAVDQSVGEELSVLPGVASVSGLLEGEVSAEGAPYFLLFGYDPDSYAMSHYRIVEGQALGGKREILLGMLAADIFDKQVGDTFGLYSSAYRIVGIYETGAPMEDGGGVIALQDAQTLLGRPRQVSLFQLKLKPGADVPLLRRRINRLFPDLTVVEAEDWATSQQNIQLLRGMAMGIAFIAVLLGGVGMMNTMLMSVFERTREIGVLRALGWRKGRVLRVILGEALALSLLGGGVGALLGVGAVEALRSSVAVGALLQGRFSVGLFVQALGVSLLLASVGGFYPAWRASRLAPIEALRYEGGSGASEERSVLRPLSALVSSAHLPATLRALLRRRTRTLLTVVGIGVSAMVVVSLGGLVQGFAGQLSGMAGEGESDLMAVEADISDMAFSTIDQRVGSQLSGQPGVSDVSGIILSVVSSPDMGYLIILGYHPHERAIRHFRIVEGEGLTANRQMLLGRAAAEALEKGVGDTMHVGNSVFRVVGIYETGVSWEDVGALIPLRDAQALLSRPRRVSFYSIKLEDPKQAEEVLARLRQDFPELNISKTAELADSLPDFQSADALVYSISLLAAVAGGIGMMNTMLMAVFERTREIGTLRALGWHRRRILVLILKESLTLSLIGGLVGVGAGMGLGAWLSRAPGFLRALEPTFTPGIVLQALGMALVLGSVGGLYPAWWASRLSPGVALRYE